MNAREWTDWFIRNRARAAEHGVRVTRVVVSHLQEKDWDRAYLEDVMGVHGLSLNEKASAYLCGVPVVFTKKLGDGHALFVLEAVR